MNYVHPDLLDDTLDVVTGETYYLAFHSGDPEGSSGLHESVGLSRVQVPDDIWGMFFDHPTSGRASSSGSDLNFGQSSAAENLTWAALWSASTGGEVRATRQLVVPLETVVGTTVLVPQGLLRWRAYGGAPAGGGDGDGDGDGDG